MIDLDDLLTDLERRALEHASCALARKQGGGEHGPDLAGILSAFGHVYIEGRIAGLCQQGALELFVDAARAGVRADDLAAIVADDPGAAACHTGGSTA